MRTANPAFSEKVWNEQRDASHAGWAMPGGTTAAPAAAPRRRTAVMTLGGVVGATSVCMVILLVGASLGWSRVDDSSIESASLPGWWWVASIGVLVLAIVTIYNPKLARVTAPIYALVQGVALGAISHVYEVAWDGIVLQAILATLGVFLTMLFLFTTGVLRPTRKFVMGVVAATGGIFVMYLAGFLFSLFGVDIAFWNEASPLGIGISVVIVIVAALNLVISFGFIQQSIESGAMPRYMNWFAAFSLMVTLIWLYLEILRLLALLRQR